MDEVLLMTATISPKNTPFVSISSEEERLHQYICSLLCWIQQSKIEAIIFCENSNTSYDFTPIINFAKQHGKILEVLIFDGNQESQTLGKGYGEGKILEYVLNTSKLMHENTTFYKITGRLFVKIFDQIREGYIGSSNAFKIPHWIQRKVNSFELLMRHSRRCFFTFRVRGIGGIRAVFMPDNNVSSVFFKSNVSFFKTYLSSAYRYLNDSWGYSLEMAYYDCLFNRDYSLLKEELFFVGKSGTTSKLINGFDYSDEIKELADSYIKK